MAHEHKHGQDHGHEHGHDHDHDHARLPCRSNRCRTSSSMRPASLSRTLCDISFTILKVIMIILIVAFLASGFRTVGPDERALVLRFGKIQGIGDEAILGPGPHWVFPYPIDELVKIPVEKNINLPVNTFWYKETRDDILGAGVKPRTNRADKLDPMVEGYCLTRSQAMTAAAAGPGGDWPEVLGDSEGSDYNIVHTKWQINYQISNVEQFFRNVYVRDVKPGEIYSEIMIDEHHAAASQRGRRRYRGDHGPLHDRRGAPERRYDSASRPAARSAEAGRPGERHPRRADAVGQRQVAHADRRSVRGVRGSQPEQRPGDHAGQDLRRDEPQQSGRPGRPAAVRCDPGPQLRRAAAGSTLVAGHRRCAADHRPGSGVSNQGGGSRPGQRQLSDEHPAGVPQAAGTCRTRTVSGGHRGSPEQCRREVHPG